MMTQPVSAVTLLTFEHAQQLQITMHSYSPKNRDYTFNHDLLFNCCIMALKAEEEHTVKWLHQI